MNRKVLFLIFLVALSLRLINLSSIPAGFHADEARVGWNAYSILKTGADDRGNSFSLHYNTFGDYRPTGIFYFTIPSILIFGPNEFAVRLPSALLGAASVYPLYLLASLPKFNHKSSPLLASFFLAVSPWHIATSRGTSEVVISLFFTLWALYFFTKALHFNQLKYFIYTIIFFFTSYSLYHSIRLLAPLLAFSLFIYYYKRTWRSTLKRAIITISILSLTTFAFAISPEGQGRFNQVSILNNRNSSLATAILQQYTSYFTFDFLASGLSKPLRYLPTNSGLLTMAGFIFLLAGLVKSLQKRAPKIVLILMLISPLAASVTMEDSPNLNRSMLMLPMFTILMASGVKYLNKATVFLLALLFIINWSAFGVNYTNSGTALATNRNFATKNMVLYLNEVSSEFEEVIITNDPDDPYPWFAFHNNLDPRNFNQSAANRVNGPWKYKNILFTQSECPSGDIFPGAKEDYLEKNLLVIDGFKCPTEAKLKDGMKARLIKQFNNPDGSTAYTAWVPMLAAN